jgi:hypothetical protein
MLFDGAGRVTEQQARTTANVLMIGAAAGTAYVLMRDPKLRRLVWQLARTYVRGPLAVWVLAEVRRAWHESARA